MNEKLTPNMSHSGLQKESSGTIGQIYKNHYGKSPNIISEYAAIAIKDFPTLKDSDIRIITFGGIRKKYIMGIRFTIPENTTPPGDYYNFEDGRHLDEVL